MGAGAPSRGPSSPPGRGAAGAAAPPPYRDSGPAPWRAERPAPTPPGTRPGPGPGGRRSQRTLSRRELAQVQQGLIEEGADVPISLAQDLADLRRREVAEQPQLQHGA